MDRDNIKKGILYLLSGFLFVGLLIGVETCVGSAQDTLCEDGAKRLTPAMVYKDGDSWTEGNNMFCYYAEKGKPGRYYKYMYKKTPDKPVRAE